MSIETLNEKLYKGSKKTLYYVAVVPVNAEGKVLLGERRGDGIWTTPGGGANEGETPEQAAIREAWEEAGLAIVPSMLELICVKATPNRMPIHCFMVRTNQTNLTVAMDPDREVSEWKWYSREELPAGLSRQKNQNRLETINQALMKFHGVSKADKIPGGLADKKKPEDFDQKALAQGIKIEMEHTSDEKIAREIAMDHLTEDSKYYEKLKEMEKADVISLIDKLSKGGPGSGIVGHISPKKPSELHPSVKAPPADPTTKLKAHLQALEHGKVVPGLTTQSGKPIVNDMDVARAQGYDAQDHIDAMNAHFQLAEKTRAAIEKLEMAGHKVPKEGEAVVKFHAKKMKEHMRARQYIEARHAHTEQAVKEQKQAAKKSLPDSLLEKLSKTATQMGGGLGDRDLDVSAFAQANSKADAEWMEKLYSGMDGFAIGDGPRSFDCERGKLHLIKVDDGLYNGYFTNVEDGLEDNARVRIERITIPELVQLMLAKEWIKNHELARPETPVEVESKVELPRPQSPDFKMRAFEVLLDKLLN